MNNNILKSLRLGTALIAVIAIPITNTLLASPVTAANQRLQASTSKLAMKTETSNSVTSIANVTTPILIAGFSNNVSGVMAKVVVYNVNYDGEKFTGQVLNKTGKTARYIKLHYEAVNEQGQLIDEGPVYVTEDVLRHSQNGTFQGITPPGGTHLIIKSAEWLDD